jgi:hypothetical protein
MELNTTVMQAVEQLDYRVTVGDVSSKAGIDLNTAERGLLALASEAGGHLQVAESGEIAYLFPKNFRGVLRSKHWRLRWQEWWQKVWGVLFYLIRISFGILLIASIILIALAIIILLVAANSSRNEGSGRGGSRSMGGGMIFVPRFWFGPDFFWLFRPGYRRRRSTLSPTLSPRSQTARRQQYEPAEMSFLEAVFSFLFGDGDPNADLEERRWQSIATVIRNNGGAVIAEQIAPYLDDLGSGFDRDYENYMLPVLTRFNGRPQVSPDGQLVYHFPELQVTAAERRKSPVSAYLKENPWKFSNATSSQMTMAAGLGVLNFVLALVLGGMLQDQVLVAELGGLVAFVNALFPLLLSYGTAFLAIPTIRYFWLKRRNAKVERRNEQRQKQAIALNQAGDQVQHKLTYAQQFAAQTVIGASDLAYTTERDLTDQEYDNREKLDAEWQKRLEQSDS